MVRICHLSDIHLPSMPTPARGELQGKQWTGWTNWKRKRRHQSSMDVLDALVAEARSQSPDHWALTGDLVNIALEGEMRNAKDWLRRLATPDKTSLVCGNHDAYMPNSLAMAAKLWGPWLAGEAEAFPTVGRDWKAFDAVYPLMQRVGDVALISVNSGKPTPPFRATGLASNAQLARLEVLLEELGEAGLCRVVLIHHPPMAKATHRHKRLIGAGRFRRVLQKAGAELVLYGHTHLDTVAAMAGPSAPIPCICVPAAAQLPGHKRPPAAFNRLDIRRTGDAWTIDLMRIGLKADATPVAPFSFSTLHTQTFSLGSSGLSY
ncbi:MAG: metallophosphoesterase, partial [Pseudomonadota bacterium]